jgi:carbonic anhydrase/acetyltransferase-like protein (isoleucine patch superfamily)
MILEHQGKSPIIDETAYIAPNAVICGDVNIGAHSRVLFGAVVTAEGGTVAIGDHAIIMENAVVRATKYHPTIIGRNVLIGPRAYLTGCIVEDRSFLATGSTVFNGAVIGTGSEVRINGVVHVNTVLASDSMVPIGWVALGDPAEVLPPHQHGMIWAIQQQLDFPSEVFGMEREETRALMPELTRRYCRSLKSHSHDRVVDPEKHSNRSAAPDAPTPL